MARHADNPGTESYIKRHAIIYARTVGFTVIDTASHRRGARAGIPDAFIGHRRSPGRWVAVEFKRPGGRLTAEQQALFDDRMLSIVDTTSGMVDVLKYHFPEITK